MTGPLLVFLLLSFGSVEDGNGDELASYMSNEYVRVPCPHSWDPSPPCACYDQSSAMSVICENVSSGEQLSTVFTSLQQPAEFTDFILRRSQLDTLPSGVFGLARFMGFEIVDTMLKTVERGAFQGSEETANGIAFLKNRIEEFDFASLRPLKNLAMFTMSSERLRSIPDDAFANVTKLAAINFVKNSIVSIGHRAFANLSNVHYIIISGNRAELASVGELAFHNPEARTFERLVLSSNNISDTTFSPKTFVGVNVTYVDLQQNQLTTLDKEVFEPLLTSMADHQNGLLMGSGNAFVCDQRLAWLIGKTIQVKRLLIGFECSNGKYVAELTEQDLSSIA